MLEALIAQEQERRRSPDELKSRICPDSSACSITDAFLFYFSVAAVIVVFEVAAAWCRWRFDHQIDDDTMAVSIGILFFLSVGFAIMFIAVIMICAMNRKAVGISAANIRTRINSFDPKRPLKDAFPRARSADRYGNEVMMPKTSTLLKPARDIVLDEMREIYAQNQKLLGQQVRVSE